MHTFTAIITFERQALVPEDVVSAVTVSLAQTTTVNLRVLQTHVHSAGCLEDGEMEIHDDGSCSYLECDPVGDLHQVIFAVTLRSSERRTERISKVVSDAAITADPLGLWVTTLRAPVEANARIQCEPGPASA
ncbi:hypothetical protein NHL50_11285 [Acidimicrobiia bacterium EGI L10123]|uniref:hypothetical protein n=1 Tax=Salinilacustrithrix flava TaxID=2957203 RepID=UPI003D7C3049|nr:hypothetical protein [Acidimicrobiia bacterium EGI L10123]